MDSIATQATCQCRSQVAISTNCAVVVPEKWPPLRQEGSTSASEPPPISRMPGVPTGDQITDKALVCPLLMQQISRLERLDLGYRLHL